MVAALVTYGNRKQLQLKKKKCVFPCFFVWTCLVRRCDCMRIPIGINRTAQCQHCRLHHWRIYPPTMCRRFSHTTYGATHHILQHSTRQPGRHQYNFGTIYWVSKQTTFARKSHLGKALHFVPDAAFDYGAVRASKC